MKVVHLYVSMCLCVYVMCGGCVCVHVCMRPEEVIRCPSLIHLLLETEVSQPVLLVISKLQHSPLPVLHEPELDMPGILHGFWGFELGISDLRGPRAYVANTLNSRVISL